MTLFENLLRLKTCFVITAGWGSIKGVSCNVLTVLCDLRKLSLSWSLLSRLHTLWPLLTYTQPAKEFLSDDVTKIKAAFEKASNFLRESIELLTRLRNKRCAPLKNLRRTSNRINCFVIYITPGACFLEASLFSESAIC